MVQIQKYVNIINIKDLSLNKVWEKDADTNDQIMELKTLFTNIGLHTFTEFYKKITGLDITEIPKIHNSYIGLTGYSFNAEPCVFKNYLHFLRNNGLREWEHEHNVKCEIQYDEDQNIVLYALLPGLRTFVIDYICKDCYRHGTYEIDAYNLEDALTEGFCSYCSGNNLIHEIDAEDNSIYGDNCIHCDHLNYYYFLDDFEKCEECGRSQE